MDPDIRYRDEGSGPAILVLHPGMDDGSRWGAVAARLTATYRVVRPHRRQYRLDLHAPDGGFTMAQEAADVAELARTLGTPLLLVGHSSGGVAALEALVATPELFTGALLFDPAVTLRADPWDEPLARSRAAVAEGKPGRAMRIFSREVLRLPTPVAWLGGAYVALRKPYRELVPRQIDDMKAIHELGVRLGAYAAITTPVLLLRGERSTALARERDEALAAVLPNADQAVLAGLPHDANRTAPGAVAHAIDGFYHRLLDR
ncbi:alpha/beta fold hydrolase [Phytomonospora endophytica]|uniref:Pimeloyl-ACP methyl ester carboxylesterase n=1 Tax=Phytomonospora endophytica TaxID=714109 RepID=A0A841G4P9_9ACTN|nr:alpha/beta hydrolase [Phytomonospora endophytica]MBB6039719.1 pimeloyl-ACP methyl ester carboxylesterase [Phytomonospora endophytica]GIG70945.1 hypothetical protein Pen01_72400 [Phytomonospora endophytica]